MEKGAEKVMFKMNEELLRSNKALEQFAYVASHDLQEPLRTVSSFTQLLSKKYNNVLDDNAREYIQYIVEGAERMYEMINALLAYSKVQTQGKEFRIVDMNLIMDLVMKNLSVQIKNRGASVTYDRLPGLLADESQMVQLLQNLVSNGVKFGSQLPEVHISCKDEPGFHIFSVSDNGTGIEPQYFERIFKIFQRLVPKNEVEGTGIGLAICKNIVERHGGKIWVESEPGKGSIFYFSIPAKI
jgi:light-regulated signal transduction histidine kinase (bacteriophytochrome)